MSMTEPVKPRRVKMPAYERRDMHLFKMGYSCYAAYLSSSLWLSIKSMVLSLHPECRVCGQQASEVHHRKYTRAVLLGTNIGPLMSVCRPCHRRAEFERDRKVSLREANRRVDSARQVPLTPQEAAWL